MDLSPAVVRSRAAVKLVKPAPIMIASKVMEGWDMFVTGEITPRHGRPLVRDRSTSYW